MPIVAGRYVLSDEIASGGMATVHFGQQTGAAGFARVVAVKRLHPERARDPEFVEMFVDEARLAARVRHPNVVSTLDVVNEGTELFLVMEYVAGESLATLIRGSQLRGTPVPCSIAASVLVGALLGLHAAHEAVDPNGVPLGIVHRDVSPQNVIVGTDGVARVLDFGIAKANVKMHATRAGQTKGKLAYMAPEHIEGEETTRASDVYSAGVVLWETIAGKRLFHAANEGALLARVLAARIPPLSEVAPWAPAELGRVIACATDRAPQRRFATAKEMAIAIERATPVASPREVGEWVEVVAHEALARRAARMNELERRAAVAEPSPSAPRSARRVEPRFSDRPQAVAPTPPGSSPHDASSNAFPNGPRSSPPLALSLPQRGTPLRTETVAHARSNRGLAVLVRWTAIALGLAAFSSLLWLVFRGPRSAGLLPSPSVSVHRYAPSATASSESAALPDATVSVTGSAPSAAAPVASEVSTPDAAALPTSGPLSTSRHPAATVPGKSSSAPVVSCDPPYYVDSEGIQRVKRECLQKAQ